MRKHNKRDGYRCQLLKRPASVSVTHVKALVISPWYSEMKKFQVKTGKDRVVKEKTRNINS